LKAIAYTIGTLILAIGSFVVYNSIFIVNVTAMTIALYMATSLVIGVELKRLLNVFMISLLAVIVSSFCFSLFQPFIALFIFVVVSLVAVKYSLIKDHDSGWFGAICAELMAIIFLLIIEIILVVAQLLLF